MNHQQHRNRLLNPQLVSASHPGSHFSSVKLVNSTFFRSMTCSTCESRIVSLVCCTGVCTRQKRKQTESNSFSSTSWSCIVKSRCSDDNTSFSSSSANGTTSGRARADRMGQESESTFYGY